MTSHRNSFPNDEIVSLPYFGEHYRVFREDERLCPGCGRRPGAMELSGPGLAVSEAVLEGYRRRIAYGPIVSVAGREPR
jgi:hypothetical protein